MQVAKKRKRLLRHPTVTSLLNRKWHSFGRYIYWTGFITYVAFLILLSVYMAIVPPRFTVDVNATLGEFDAGNDCVR